MYYLIRFFFLFKISRPTGNRYIRSRTYTNIQDMRYIFILHCTFLSLFFRNKIETVCQRLTILECRRKQINTPLHITIPSFFQTPFQLAYSIFSVIKITYNINILISIRALRHNYFQ